MAFTATVSSDDLLVAIAMLRDIGATGCVLSISAQTASTLVLDAEGINYAQAAVRNATGSAPGRVRAPIATLFAVLYNVPQGSAVTLTEEPAALPVPVRLTISWPPTSGSAHSVTVPLEGLETLLT